MAFVLDPDDDEQNNQGQTQAAAPQIGGQSAQVGGAPAATGVGKGGVGGFTNLQNYLSANAGDSGGTAALNETVNSEFGKEKENITGNANKYVQDAQKQVTDSSINNEQADDLINKSALTYDYGGKHQDGYSQNVDKVRGALTNQYSGPRDYSYGLGAKTQEYGTALTNDQSFNGLMGNIYSQKAGQPLSSGQKNLQSQLDVHNTSLNDARKKLLGDYTGLESLRDDTVKNTTEKLGGLEQQYRMNQNNLRDYLGLQSNTYDTKAAQAEIDARKSYNDTYTKEGSGRVNAYQPAMPSGGGTENMRDRGVWGADGTNLTWEQLQREQGLGAPGSQDYYYQWMTRPGFINSPNPQERDIASRFQGSGGALNQFYGAQDEKYANTADTEKRSYNAIQDFLNSEAARKEAGFQVRKK